MLYVGSRHYSGGEFFGMPMSNSVGWLVEIQLQGTRCPYSPHVPALRKDGGAFGIQAAGFPSTPGTLGGEGSGLSRASRHGPV